MAISNILRNLYFNNEEACEKLGNDVVRMLVEMPAKLTNPKYLLEHLLNLNDFMMDDTNHPNSERVNKLIENNVAESLHGIDFNALQKAPDY
jgi:hypothetical protein